MSYEQKGVGRIKYIEPTNINFDDSRGYGIIQSTTRINNPYEDYCIAVDLRIKIFDRNSCGGINNLGEEINIVYTTSRQNKTMFNGTDGVLTTNYTDINTIYGSSNNTVECLGLESLNISYQSWMYPEVTARFIDVRGSSVMMQEEENLNDNTGKRSMYRAFFTFPYPMFELKVKGFYGKGATFYLTVEDVKISFDANSGNFVFDVKFIGMMYRIYTDLPMLYCCVAPFMPQGIGYWDEMVNNGVFVFRQIDSSTSNMIRFPELMAKIYSIDSNSEMVESKAAQAEEEENFAEETSILTSVSNIPFIDSTNPMLLESMSDDNKLVAYISKNTDEWKKQRENIKQYYETISGCDATYGTNYTDKFNKFVRYRTGSYDYIEPISFKIQRKEGKKFTDTAPQIKDITLSQKDLDTILEYADWQSTTNELTVHILTVNNEDYKSFQDNIKEKIKNIDSQKQATENRYKKEQNLIIEKILGFRPSVKNFYNLAFAHMDTFMHCFNDMLRNISEQMTGGGDERDLETYGIGNGGDITTDVPETYTTLPPFPAIYKKELTEVPSSDGNTQAQQMRTVEQWLEDIPNGEKFEEVTFTKDLLIATKMYIEEIEAIQSAFTANQWQSSGDTGTSETPSGMNYSAFIPLTSYDVSNNVYVSNPYYDAKQKALANNRDLGGSILATLSTRLFLYLSTNKNAGVNASAAGKIEAINLYKALGTVNSTEFLDFLKKHIFDGSYEDLINTITGGGDSEISKAWDFSDVPNCSNKLFEKSGNKLKYCLYKTGTRPMPCAMSNLASIKKEYVTGVNKDSTSFIDTDNIISSKRRTFKILEDASIFASYGGKLKSEVENVKNSKPQKTDEDGKEISDNSNLVLLDDFEMDGIANMFETTLSNNPYQTRNDTNKTFYKKDKDGNYSRSGNINDDVTDVLNGNAEKTILAVKNTSTNGQFSIVKLHESYEASDLYGKAYMFLMNFLWTTNGIEEAIDKPQTRNSKNGIKVKAKILLEGAILYRMAKLKNGGQDILKNKFGNGYVLPGQQQVFCGAEDIALSINPQKDTSRYFNYKYPVNHSPHRSDVLIDYFKNWVNTKFKPVSEKLFKTDIYDDVQNLSLNLNLIKSSSASNSSRDAIEVQNFLRDTFLTSVTTVETYMLNDNNQKTLTASVQDMRTAFSGFISAMKELYGDLGEKLKSDENAVEKEVKKRDAEDPFKSVDIKMSTYITLKNLYDKWLACPYKGPDTWSYTGETSDFKSFIYIDSMYHDIGYSILANTNRVAEWIGKCMPSSELNGSYGSSVRVSSSVFEYLAEIAQHTGGILIAFPQKIGMDTDLQVVTDMFEAFSFDSDWDTDSSCFVYIYTYKPSEHLGTDQYADDGILDLTADELVDTFGDDGYSIPAFGVTFAKQNQSYFKNLTLNTESTTTTEASLAAASAIASKGSEAPKEMSFFGQDLYKVRTSYSYECSFEMMGNIQVMPLMYFQLNNVPFWRGAYMIFKVTHTISPGNMTTTVTGIRINKYALPISDGTVLSSGGHTGQQPGDMYATNNSQYQGQFVADDTYTPMSSVADTIDFDPSKIDSKHPLICITPGYGPNFKDKTASWKICYDLVENHIIKKLKGLKYKDGVPVNYQMCNKDGNHTTTNSCLMSQTEGYIKQYGEDCVISVVPRIPTGSSNYFKVFYGGKTNSGQIVATDESKKLAEMFVSEVKEMITKQVSYKEMTPGMMSTSQTNGVLISEKTESIDFGPSLKCASVVTYNWFDGYPSSEICRKALTRTALEKTKSYKEKDSTGKYFISQGWLNSNEGKEAIAIMHINAIKKYIDTKQ